MKTWMFSLILSCTLSPLALAVDLEHLSITQRQELHQLFVDSAKLKTAEALVGKSWNCDMYGMRSGLQVERSLSLYNFEKTSSPQRLNNKGAQLVRSYQWQAEELQGANGGLADTVRLTQDGRLIGELSIPKRDGSNKDQASAVDGRRAVIAYSVCRAI